MAKKTTETDRPELHVLVTEERSAGFGYSAQYYHLTARVVAQKFENHEWTPYGDLRDDYDGPLYANLRIRCQGDDDSRQRAADREQVYGFSCEYHDVHTVDASKAERMHKTLKTIAAKLDKFNETRGYIRSFGEYVGRIAEAIGAAGIGIDHGKPRQYSSRYEWQSIGDGINRTNGLVWQWIEEGKPKPATETAQTA